MSDQALPLAGLKVVELSGGAAGSYCGRLLVDGGAQVTSIQQADATSSSGVVRAGVDTDKAYNAYLSAGKRVIHGVASAELIAACNQADLVIIGEDVSFDVTQISPKYATVDVSWFGSSGPYKDWKGSDLIVQALTGMLHLAGPKDGPPLYSGDRHATVLGGMTAYLAAMAGIVADPAAGTRRFEVSVLEANYIITEMQFHFVEKDKIPLKRHGINRFSPNAPVGVYPCKDGWVGIIAATPDQWRTLCTILDMPEIAADAALNTREQRFARIDEVEDAMSRALMKHTAEEWSNIGRERRVPILGVPNAKEIFAHPIFNERKAFSLFKYKGADIRVPRTPVGIEGHSNDDRLDTTDNNTSPFEISNPLGEDGSSPPLTGLNVLDFSMGWAGPLVTRMLADLGANILKIEAGRYPDWWRGVNWSREYIENKLYEDEKKYCALNRGKKGVSLDLTNAQGRALALKLAAKADIVVENQASGVMRKMGLAYDNVSAANPNVVMLSMSAFGGNNKWSETRAYGSTLEQGAGIPSFIGVEGTPPTMAHLAYGDPIAGLFACATLMTGLVRKKRTGKGQWLNFSMVEAALQLNIAPLIEYQLTGKEPVRLGNKHLAMAPHGVYPCAGTDRWIAISVADDEAFRRLAEVIGCTDLLNESGAPGFEWRKSREAEIDKAITAWTGNRDSIAVAKVLQAAGVAAAPVHHTHEVATEPHLEATRFFVDLKRQISGPQRQLGIGIQHNGKRLGSKMPAPILGEHSWEVLSEFAGVTRAEYDALIGASIVSFTPQSLRATLLDNMPNKVAGK